MNGLHLCISSTAFIHHFYYYLFQADHIMSSSAAGPPPHLLVWGSAASSGNGSEAAGASGASSGFDSDSSPSSVASATSSSAGLRPCPSLAAISCSHLGARPKGRPLAPAVPPPRPPMGRPPSTSDPLTDCRERVAPPWLQSCSGGSEDFSRPADLRASPANGCGTEVGAGDGDQPCNQSGMGAGRICTYAAFFLF